MSLKIDREYYKKKYRNLYKKKVLLNITKFLKGSGSTTTSSTLSTINPSVGIVILSCAALLTSRGILITNEYLLKLKVLYTKIGDWIKAIPFSYEKTSKQSMIVKKIDGKLAQELVRIYNDYPDKRY